MFEFYEQITTAFCLRYSFFIPSILSHLQTSVFFFHRKGKTHVYAPICSRKWTLFAAIILCFKIKEKDNVYKRNFTLSESLVRCKAACWLYILKNTDYGYLTTFMASAYTHVRSSNEIELILKALCFDNFGRKAFVWGLSTGWFFFLIFIDLNW